MLCYLSLQVIDQKPSGVWRGFLVKDGRKIGPGYFPSNCVAIDRTTKCKSMKLVLIKNKDLPHVELSNLKLLELLKAFQ